MLCFRKLLVGKDLWIRRVEGSYLNFPSKIFCLTVQKHFVEEAFFAVYQKIAGNKKVYGKEMGMGEYRKFPSKIFCFKLPKQFVGETFTLSLVSGIEIVYASEGYVTIFRGNFFVSQYRNFS